MTATYAKKTFTVEVGGKPFTIFAGEKRDSVADASLIAAWASNFSAGAAPVAGVGDITGIMAGWLAAYPRAEVS